MKTRPRWIVAREDKEEDSLWLRLKKNYDDYAIGDFDDANDAYNHTDHG